MSELELALFTVLVAVVAFGPLGWYERDQRRRRRRDRRRIPDRPDLRDQRPT